jgi:hypothetical protein
MSGKLDEKVILDRKSELPVRAAPTHPSCTLVPTQTDAAHAGKPVMRCRSELTGVTDELEASHCVVNLQQARNITLGVHRRSTVNPEYPSVSPALWVYCTLPSRNSRMGVCRRAPSSHAGSVKSDGDRSGTGDRGPGTGTGVSAPCRGHRQAALEGTCRLGVPRCDGAAR